MTICDCSSQMLIPCLSDLLVSVVESTASTELWEVPSPASHESAVVSVGDGVDDLEDEVKEKSNEWDDERWEGGSSGNRCKSINENEEDEDQEDGGVNEPHEPSDDVGGLESSEIVSVHWGVLLVDGGHGPDDGIWEVDNKVHTSNGECETFEEGSEDAESINVSSHKGEHVSGLDEAHNTVEPVGTHGSLWEIGFGVAILKEWIACSNS